MLFSNAYTLFCPSGMEIVLLEAGAALTSVRVAGRDGSLADVALPLTGLDDPSRAGVTLAPYAGRIPGGRLRIDGATVQLTRNEGDNQIHGGADSPARRLWRMEGTREGRGFQEITFSAEAEDGLEGYPGNRRFTATYRLHADQRVEILLRAQTDRPTRVNLSNHAYFNLSGDFSRDVSRHLMRIDSDEVYLNDDAFLMAGRAPVAPPLDFTRLRPIGPPRGHPQLDAARGLNHCYILRAGAPAATLVDPDSGRRMRLYTDHRCLMVYSGGFLDTPNCAVALEAQEHPESPFAPPGRTLYPGESYLRRIVYAFDIAPQ